MISTQLLDGVLLALAVLAGAAITLSVVIFAAASAAKRGQAPHGGTRREAPQPSQPDTGDARVLVLR
jgi:uncharacterized membrane protein